MNVKGQVAVYVLIGIIIVAAIGLVYVLYDSGSEGEFSGEYGDVYEYYSNCIEQDVDSALSIAGSQGGYIDVPAYSLGSSYAPSSNQLNFLGIPVPYWYYVSGNGIVKEQVPSLSEIEQGIEVFLEDNIESCDLRVFEDQGLIIENDFSSVDVNINEDYVEVIVYSDMVIQDGDVREVRSSHGLEIPSSFGKLYSEASKIYSKQKEEAFLEKYALDVLYNYAPVDGVDVDCSPSVWKTAEIEDELKEGLEGNLAALRFGNKEESEEGYFFVDEELDSNVQVMYSSNWPTKLEIEGDGVQDEILVAKPVGAKEGLGVMGFCYIPYHFVYDLYFPVMIQLYEGDDIFQFPVVGIIEDNSVREPIYSADLDLEEEDFDLCEYQNENLDVYLYDENLDSVEGSVSFECFSQSCDLGDTANGILNAKSPACVNGNIVVDSEGYSLKKVPVSTNDQNFVEVILQREREVEVEVLIDGSSLGNGKTAMISFSGENNSGGSVIVPGNSKINLVEGYYDVEAYVYQDSEITVPGYTKRECVEVPRGVIGGFFGLTKESCYDIEIEESVLDNVIVGGGKTRIYLLDSDLSDGKISVSSSSFPNPDSLEQLQNNLASLEVNYLEVYP